MGFWRNIRGHSVFMVPGQSFSATIDKYEAEHGKLPGPLRQAHARAATGRDSKMWTRGRENTQRIETLVRRMRAAEKAGQMSPGDVGRRLGMNTGSVRKANAVMKASAPLPKTSPEFDAAFAKFSKEWDSDPQNADFPGLVRAAKKDGAGALYQVIDHMAGTSYPAHAAPAMRARMSNMHKDFMKFLDDPATVAAAERLAQETHMGSKRIEWDDKESYKRVRAAYEAAGGKHSGDDEALFTAMDGNRNFWGARQGQSPIRRFSGRGTKGAIRRAMNAKRANVSPWEESIAPEELSGNNPDLSARTRDALKYALESGDFTPDETKKLKAELDSRKNDRPLDDELRLIRAAGMEKHGWGGEDYYDYPFGDYDPYWATTKKIMKSLGEKKFPLLKEQIRLQEEESADFDRKNAMFLKYSKKQGDKKMKESNVQPYMGGHMGDHGKQAERLMRNQWPTGNAVKGTKSPHGFGEPSSSMEMLKKHMADRFRNMSTTTGRPGAFKDGVKPQGGTAETATGMKPGGTANPDWLKGE
jgi:hypothetical protein